MSTDVHELLGTVPLDLGEGVDDLVQQEPNESYAHAYHAHHQPPVPVQSAGSQASKLGPCIEC